MNRIAATALICVAINLCSALAVRASLGLNTSPNFTGGYFQDATKLKQSFEMKIPNVASAEESEERQFKQNNPALLFKAMIGTAHAYLFEGQVDKAVEKWKAALALAKKWVVDDVELPKQKRPLRGPPLWIPENPLQRSTIAGALVSLGPEFESAGRLVRAEEVYLESYRLAFASARIAPRIRLNVELLAKKYQDSGDTAYGAGLLNTFLSLAKEYHGPNSSQIALWQLKLANFYAASGETKLTKKFCADFLASLEGSGLGIGVQTMQFMTEHAYILRANGFKTEADRVDRKLSKIHKMLNASSAEP